MNETPGVAFVAFTTDSPHHSRGDVHLADLARTLRRAGCPSRLFQVHVAANDTPETERRVQRLLERIAATGCRWAVFHEVWTPELARRLHEAGVRVVEMRSHTFAPALFADEHRLLLEVSGGDTRPALDDSDLVEVIGGAATRPVTAVDLRIQQACSFKRTLADNPFYRDLLDNPTVAAHRGCAYCLNAQPSSDLGAAEDVAERILERIRADRQAFPQLDTFWMTFAETFYDALAVAFRKHRDDAAWRGITLAMQCRPDVIARRAADIEALAAGAAACGTLLRIAVVGFENFSPREILVLNRGAAPEDLDSAAVTLNRWTAHPPTGLLAAGFTPSFILFTPWTRPEDLDLNLERIAAHGLWQANIERLRLGPATPAFEKARRDGLVVDGPVRAATHPNGYLSEREIRFADPAVASVSAGFERLRPLAPNEQPELLAGVLAAVRAAADPTALDWEGVAGAWTELGAAARGS